MLADYAAAELSTKRKLRLFPQDPYLTRRSLGDQMQPLYEVMASGKPKNPSWLLGTTIRIYSTRT